MASSIIKQEGVNLSSDWLEYQSWQDGPPDLSHKMLFGPCNKSSIEQHCSVKMAGYWPYSFFRFYTRTYLQFWLTGGKPRGCLEAYVNPLLSPLGACIFQAHLKGGFFEWVTGGGLFNLEKTMVLLLNEELKYKLEKLVQEGWRSWTQGSESNQNFPVGK